MSWKLILYHSLIHEYAKCTWDFHIYIHRNLEIRKTCNDFSVQVRNFLLLLSLKVFRHNDREAQSFYSRFFICPPNTCDTSPRPPRASESQPSRLVSSLNSTKFIQILKIFRVLPVCDVIHTLYPHFSSWAIVTSLSDTSVLNTRM